MGKEEKYDPAQCHIAYLMKDLRDRVKAKDKSEEIHAVGNEIRSLMVDLKKVAKKEDRLEDYCVLSEHVEITLQQYMNFACIDVKQMSPFDKTQLELVITMKDAREIINSEPTSISEDLRSKMDRLRLQAAQLCREAEEECKLYEYDQLLKHIQETYNHYKKLQKRIEKSMSPATSVNMMAVQTMKAPLAAATAGPLTATVRTSTRAAINVGEVQTASLSMAAPPAESDSTVIAPEETIEDLEYRNSINEQQARIMLALTPKFARGFVKKKGKGLGGYKKRYFVLLGNEVKYYKEKGGELKGTISLVDAAVLNVGLQGFSLAGPNAKRAFVLETDSPAVRNIWVARLRAAIIDPDLSQSEEMHRGDPDLEVELQSAAGRTTNCFYEGYMEKKGAGLAGYKLRYFILDGYSLSYYETKGGPINGSIDIREADITTDGANIAILGPHCKRKFIFRAPTPQDQQLWVDKLKLGVKYT